MYASDAEHIPDTPLPAFRREGLGYLYEPVIGDGLGGLRLRIDYLKRGIENHSGEITIESTLPGMSGLLHQARYNLVSSTAQGNLVKAIKGIVQDSPDEALPWSRWVREFFAYTLKAEREGEPFQRTGPDVPRRVRLAPLVQRLVPQGQNTLLYGPGGVGKGWIAVGLAASVALGLPFAGFETQQANVLYCDWEDGFDVFLDRVGAISAGLSVKPPENIHYRECYGSLREQTHQLARHVAEEHIGLLVVDSVEMAAATSGEQATYEDRARGLFEALRAMRAGLTRPLAVLLIDHVSEAGRQQSKGASKPYGSVFKTNWSRLAWEVRKQQDAEDLTSHLGLYQWKSNHTATMSALGLCIEWDDPFEPDSVTISSDEVGDYEELASRLGARDQIKAVLVRSGALPPKEIAELSGLPVNRVRVTLHRDQSGRAPWFVKQGEAYALAGKEEPHLTVVRYPYKDDDQEAPRRGINDDEIPF